MFQTENILEKKMRAKGIKTKEEGIEIYEDLYVRSGTQDRAMVRDALYEDYPYANCKDHIVLDCGAHIGAFTKRALSDGAKKVYAIEPWAPNRALLKRNFGGNPNVEILPIGISTKSTIELTVPNDRDTGAVSGFVNHRSPTRSEIVEAVSLEDLIAETQATFVKLDIEAAEWEVLPCNLGTVEHICGELHTMSTKNRAAAFKFFEWIETQGYYISHLQGGPAREKMFERILWIHFHAYRRRTT